MPIRLRLALLFVAAALLWGGGQGVFTAATSRDPAVATCAEQAGGAVDAKWLELRDCLAFLPDASHFYRENGNPHAAADEVYVPLYVPGDESGELAHVVMATRDPELLAIYNGFPHAGSEEEQEAYVAEHVERMAEVRTVRGLVRYGIDLVERERNLLVGEEVAEDFIIVDEGSEPAMGTSLMLLGGGLALAFGTLGVHRLFPRNPDGDLDGPVA